MIIRSLYSKECVFVKFNQFIHNAMHVYSTNLTDNQWSKIVNFFVARNLKLSVLRLFGKNCQLSTELASSTKLIINQCRLLKDVVLNLGKAES